MAQIIFILGDGLDENSAALKKYRDGDVVLMAEVEEETAHVPSHKARIAFFFSAMRHFAVKLRRRGYRVEYYEFDRPGLASLSAALEHLCTEHQGSEFSTLVMVKPGELRVERSLREMGGRLGLEVELCPDNHFFFSPQEFKDFFTGKKGYIQESFYRHGRRRFGVLMENDEPAGGAWNFDKQNRQSFKKKPQLPVAQDIESTEITQDVIKLVNRGLSDRPGSLKNFGFPVTTDAAQKFLQGFIKNKLSEFGPWQDAMWQDEPFLFHSLLSAALNVKLLNPRQVIKAAEQAYTSGQAPLNSVEGFIRQILGWREYVRGIYFAHMPDYADSNFFGFDNPLPAFYWSGDVEYNCLRQTIGQTLQYGYAHHIQRLMVTGLFSLLLEVRPREVHAWYLAMYVDAIEWVEMPNALGMATYADGGVMATKPYLASGNYINRMSNYCKGCRFKPNVKTGDDACPYTVLYWNFLIKHESLLQSIPRMGLQLRNLERLPPEEKRAIARQAVAIQKAC